MPPKNQGAQNKNKKGEQRKESDSVKLISKPEEQEELVFYKSPIKTLSLFFTVFLRFLGRIAGFIGRHFIAFAILAAAIIVPHIVHGEHDPLVKQFDQIVEFCAYWIILGVASSIGLGTGLHTFVLYTGPHIAKLTMFANEYGNIPHHVPHRWAIRPTFEKGDVPTTFLSTLFAVQLEGFLWGLGTALGELPPYFVAKAASVAGNKNEELEELESSGANTFMDKAKLIIYKSLKNYGFITVLLCASIPNPLFDLAGITCGHFGIPLATFLGATIIGKAFVKAHLQMFFVIFLFSKHHVEHVIQFIEGVIPFLQGKLSKNFEEQKAKLLDPTKITPGQEPLIAVVWNYIILAMISYFIYKTIEALAQAELNKQNEEKKAAKKK